MNVKQNASLRSGERCMSFFISAFVMTFILPFDVGNHLTSEIRFAEA